MENRTIEIASLTEAATFYFTSTQDEKNLLMHQMFKEQPAILELIGFLDGEFEHHHTKVIILQLIMIFYKAILIQEIKMKKIPFSDFLAAYAEFMQLKDYYDHPDRELDEETYKKLFDNYPQSKILMYTNTALNVQYQPYLGDSIESGHIFYMMKIFGEVVDQNITE